MAPRRNTLVAYRNDLERAAEALADVGGATSDDLALLGEQWRDLAPATVARRSAALRRFYGFLVDDRIRGDDPSAALPRPRFERPLPRILDEAEVTRMFEAIEAKSGERRCRPPCAISPCSNCSTDRGCAPANWCRCRAEQSAPASRS